MIVLRTVLFHIHYLDCSAHSVSTLNADRHENGSLILKGNDCVQLIYITMNIAIETSWPWVITSTFVPCATQQPVKLSCIDSVKVIYCERICVIFIPVTVNKRPSWRNLSKFFVAVFCDKQTSV